MASIKEKMDQQQKIIDLIKAGKTTEQIQKKFPLVTKMQIAAYKANITMGTYK